MSWVPRLAQLFVLIVIEQVIQLRKVAHLQLIRPQETAKLWRALEEFNAFDGAVVLADGLVVLYANPPARRNFLYFADILDDPALAATVT